MTFLVARGGAADRPHGILRRFDGVYASSNCLRSFLVSTAFEVEIFGATYHLRSEHQSEELKQLAGLVDSKMRDVATQSATVDTTKVAILAALNIAEELYRARSAGGDTAGGVSSELVERVTGLADELEGALAR
ncbi:MAG: cell division protein ZapA [Acidobacteriota bacterium]